MPLTIGNYSFLANITFNSSHPTIHYTYTPDELKLWFTTVMTFVVVGCLNNAIMLVIILRQRRRRTGSDLLIAHLVLVHWIYCAVFQLVFALTSYLKAVTTYTMLSRTCRGYMWLYVSCIYVTNWSAALLALNRLVAVCASTLHYRRWSSRRIVGCMILFVWVVGFCGTVPVSFDKGGKYLNPGPQDIASCVQVVTAGYIRVLQVTVGTYIPQALQIGLHLAIYVKISAKYLTRRQVHANWVVDRVEAVMVIQRARMEKQRMVGVRMLFMSCLWCLLCYLPVPIALAIMPEISVKRPVLTLYLRSVVLAGYALNPFVFYVCNKNFRRGFCQLFQNQVFYRWPAITCTSAEDKRRTLHASAVEKQLPIAP